MISAFVEVLGGAVALLIVGLAVFGLSKVFEVRDELKRKRAIELFYGGTDRYARAHARRHR